jgi:DNA modification methylase
MTDSPDKLKLDPKNANKGTDRGRALVESSLAECGAGRSIVADKDGTVIAGNKTLEAARRLGLRLRFVETAGDELLVVKRTDLKLDEDERARRLAYLDNRSSELGLDWDLSQILADLESGLDFGACGFDERELAALLARLEANAGLTDPDLVPELPEEPVTRPGDLWVMGGHRLKCGDATSAADVAELLGDQQPFLMVTDPPYGVDYDPAWRNQAKLAHTKRTGRVLNDDRANWTEAYRLFPGDVAYVWHAGRLAGEVARDLGEAGFEIRAQIIWRKPRFAISRGHYHWQHEPCWYAVRSGRPAKWNGDRSQSTVWDIGRDDDSEQTVHGTQKPVEAMLRPIRNHGGPNDDIYDPFLGSGTTLVAAEMLGRRCLGLELDPRYCDVIVTRWANFTGQKAERLKA